MDIRDKFLSEGIPFDDIDPEMIELLDVLNFKLKLKTKFCCYGHKVGESTTVMFDDKVTDEEIVKLLIAVDNNLGTSEVKRVKLYKWARIMYQPYFKKPWHPKLNWILEIEYINEASKENRLNEVVKSIKELNIGEDLEHFL